MSQDIIGKKTRYEFREYFVGTTLREIENEFDAADIPCDMDYVPLSAGARRSHVEKYYHSIDWSKWEDIQKILIVFKNVLIKLKLQSEQTPTYITEDWAGKKLASLIKWLEKDGFKYDGEELIPLGKHEVLGSVEEKLTRFDAPELQRQLERLKKAIDDDPGLAIGTAKEIVETVCKTILEERRLAYKESTDLIGLVKEVRKALNLIPDDIPDSAKGAEIIRRLLSSLGTIVQGLGELRNLYGTGHGKAGKSKGLLARHARLAVGTASTLVVFLFETHKEKI